MSKYFPKPLKLKAVGNGIFEFTAEFVYDNEPVRVCVPVGFKTDGASIPKVVWSLVGSPWTGKYTKAAMVHDYLYRIRIYSRKRSDLIFYQAMKILGVPLWKRWAMHKAVRMFGWMPWRNKK